MSNLKSVFFKPKGGWAGDFIPFYDDGKFYLFYLLDPRTQNGHRDGISWGVAVTENFIDVEDKGVVLINGSKDDQDLCAYTGSVIKALGKYHIFYTGHNPVFRDNGLPEQKIMHAISDDLITWTKMPEHTFGAAKGYEIHDWRDPFVYWDENDNQFHMLIVARLTKGPKTRRGCTGHLISKDLITWELLEPIWAPNSYYAHECPDLFKIGDWYYLLFSEFTDLNRTRYVMSKSINGPWVSPENDVFDTRAYYAAKSWADGEKRYLFGWNPTRVDQSDLKPFHWGGNLVVHELYTNDKNELAVREPKQIKKIMTSLLAKEKIQAVNLDCITGTKTSYLPNKIPNIARIETDFTFTKGSKNFGVLLKASEEDDTAYSLTFRPAEHRLDFQQFPQHSWLNFATKGLDRLINIAHDQKHHLTLIIEDTMLTAYLDDFLAFTTRMYDLNATGFGFFVHHGNVSFENIELFTSK